MGDDADEALVQASIDTLLAKHDPKAEEPEFFLGAQFDAGLAWVHFPVGDGGLAVAPDLQRLVAAQLGAAGAPIASMRNAIGFGMGAPTIATHGTEEQRQRFLRPLFTGEERWCQLFSEPGAGSDLAGLSTRAVRDGDEWVVNGQKVWTSLAQFARWGILVARTNPDVPKHKGLTYFALDMHQPGVEVRPLRQMTGGAEFNEVYFTDARVPDANRIGDVGTGWGVSLTTLMNERVFIGGNAPPRGSGIIAMAANAYANSTTRTPADRDQFMRLWIRAEVLRLTNRRAGQNRRRGIPGAEGSIGKLAGAELNQEISSFALDLLGPVGMLYDTYDRGGLPVSSSPYANAQVTFLRCRANTIEGGTSEVMRNILGERVLGLPGDVRVDRDVPWTDVLKN